MGVLASQLKCVLWLLEKKYSQTDLILVTLQIQILLFCFNLESRSANYHDSASWTHL